MPRLGRAGGCRTGSCSRTGQGRRQYRPVNHGNTSGCNHLHKPLAAHESQSYCCFCRLVLDSGFGLQGIALHLQHSSQLLTVSSKHSTGVAGPHFTRLSTELCAVPLIGLLVVVAVAPVEPPPRGGLCSRCVDAQWLVDKQAAGCVLTTCCAARPPVATCCCARAAVVAVDREGLVVDLVFQIVDKLQADVVTRRGVPADHGVVQVARQGVLQLLAVAVPDPACVLVTARELLVAVRDEGQGSVSVPADRKAARCTVSVSGPGRDAILLLLLLQKEALRPVCDS